MKKKLKNIYLLVFGLISMFAFNMSAKASSFDVVLPMDKCYTLLGDYDDYHYPAYWVKWILNLMKYIAIIALLVLVIMDFLNAMVQNDKDALKKAGTKAIKRFIYCVILFFVPTIVTVITDLFGISGCDVRGMIIL